LVAKAEVADFVIWAVAHMGDGTASSKLSFPTYKKEGLKNWKHISQNPSLRSD